MSRTKDKKPGNGAKQNTTPKETASSKPYSGPTTTTGKISTLYLRKAGPKDFYGQFVKTRKPVVIKGTFEDLKFVKENWSDVEYLKKIGGKAKVKVEPMHKEKKRYGTDVERVETTFGKFLEGLKEEREEYEYLTTQYSDDDDDDDDEGDDAEEGEEKEEEEVEEDDMEQVKKSAFPEPVRTLLRKDVPTKPAMMGNLVLQQMNLWLGKSKQGTSSGLHHDFHDNLYVLLKGRKRFILYPPSSVEHLNTYGKVDKIHQNGLIVYKTPGEEEQEEDELEGDNVRSDGLVERDAAVMAVTAYEKQLEHYTKTGKTKGLDKLKKQHAEAVDHLLKYQMEQVEAFGDGAESEEEDEELKDQVLRDSATKSKKRKAEDDLEAPKSKKNAKAEDSDSDSDDDEDSDADLLEALEQAKNGHDADDMDDSTSEESEPLSFSQIPTTELHSHLGLSTPQVQSASLEKAGKPYIIDLVAGEMLYLPTSWFHEVTSFSDDKQQGEEQDDIHIALNYWFHPPNATAAKFEKPYEEMVLWKYMDERVKGAYEGLISGRSKKDKMMERKREGKGGEGSDDDENDEEESDEEGSEEADDDE